MKREISNKKNKVFKNAVANKYKLDRLLYWEVFEDVEFATLREKQLKNWKKEWTLGLIKSANPNFKDLSVFDIEAID